MRTLLIESFKIRVETDESAKKFLEALDLILDLYAAPADRGAREYTIEVRKMADRTAGSGPDGQGPDGTDPDTLHA